MASLGLPMHVASCIFKCRAASSTSIEFYKSIDLQALLEYCVVSVARVLICEPFKSIELRAFLEYSFASVARVLCAQVSEY